MPHCSNATQFFQHILCVSAFMPKIKGGRRHHFSAAKKSAMNVIGNPITLILLFMTSQTPTTVFLWSIYLHIFLYYLNGIILQRIVIVSNFVCCKIHFTVFKNLKWCLKVYGRPVPNDNHLYDELPTLIISVDSIVSICNLVQQMHVCEGNMDSAFISVVKSKGEKVTKNGVITAYFDHNSNTVRHTKCLLLKVNAGKCEFCKLYRATLRAMTSRSQKSDSSDSDKTSHSSHTNYRYLKEEELKERLKNVQAAKKTAERTIKRLNEKLSILIEKEGIE